MSKCIPADPNSRIDITLKNKNLFKSGKYNYVDNVFYKINSNQSTVTVIDQTNEPITYQITIDEFNKIKQQTQLNEVFMMITPTSDN